MFMKEDPDNGNVSLADWMYKGPIEEILCSIEITEGSLSGSRNMTVTPEIKRALMTSYRPSIVTFPLS